MQTLEYALKYVERGWPVLPIYGVMDGRCRCGDPDCRSPGKHPLVSGGLKAASVSSEIVTDWWTSQPYANIAIATGSSSGLLVVDIDDGPKKPGLESLRRLERANGPLPRSLSVRTGSGGLHIYLGMPSVSVRNSAGHVADGIDIRAEGGYVVAPPSVHISGNLYMWENYNA